MNKTITFYPGKSEKDVEQCSLTSFIGWQRLSNHLEKVFEISKNEKLIGIEVSDLGITAKRTYPPYQCNAQQIVTLSITAR